MSRSDRLAAGIVVLIATPLIAQDNSPPPTKPDDVVVVGKIPDADKKVCKTEAATGSIIPKRICRTKGEWQAIRERSLARLERMKEEEEERQFTTESRRNR